MDTVAAARDEAAEAPVAEPVDPVGEPLSLSLLRPGDRAVVLSVGLTDGSLTALERRLLELGFVGGEALEVIAEARPGRDPFVVRLGATALALRRQEVRSVWVCRRPSRTP